MAKNKIPCRAGLMQLLALCSLAFLGIASPAAEQQGKPDGAGPSVQGEELTLFNFVGHIKQEVNGTTFVLIAYGYLTHIYGLDDADLFAGTSAPPEVNAKYTFVTKGTFDARFVAGDGTPGSNVINIVSDVLTTYYFRDPPVNGCVGVPSSSCPEDPTPFATGTPIATSTGRDSDVNNIQSADHGVLTGNAAVTLLTTASKHSGHQLPLWKPGVKIRITYTGAAVRTDPAGPKSYSLIVGQGTVIR